MVKDGQVRILMRRMNREKTLEAAAAKAGMTAKTARKYRRLGKLPRYIGTVTCYLSLGGGIPRWSVGAEEME